MLIKTQGIVLKFVKFRESSIIVSILTEEVGLTSFVVNNVRSAKSKFKAGYFEPLSLVEITGYYHPDREINRLSEIRSQAPLHHIRQDIFKSTIILFLAEVLVKVIIERDRNQPLFNYISSALLKFEHIPENNSFHLQFLLQLLSYLGFSVKNPEDFTVDSTNQQFYKVREHQEILESLINDDFDIIKPIDSGKRSIILNDIVLYYQQHLGIAKLKSLDILSTIFR